MMKERTRLILKKSIEDYIDVGKPVTSERLYKRHDFGVKSAMIRRELHLLSQKGFFRQNHPSGGRFPTNKAYEFFVENIIRENNTNKKTLDVGERMIKLLESDRRDEFTKNLADYLELLAAVYDIHKKIFHDSGLDILFDRVEPEEKKELAKLLRDVEGLPERIKKKKSAWKSEDSEARVFIGQSPLTKSSYLSCIIKEVDVGGNRVIVVALGPRRMNYKRSLSFFQALS